MLTADGDAGGLISCLLDVVDKAWQRGNAADEERDHRPPVRAEFGRVAVHSVEVVHVRDRDISSADDEVAELQTGQHGIPIIRPCEKLTQ